MPDTIHLSRLCTGQIKYTFVLNIDSKKWQRQYRGQLQLQKQHVFVREVKIAKKNFMTTNNSKKPKKIR